MFVSNNDGGTSLGDSVHQSTGVDQTLLGAIEHYIGKAATLSRPLRTLSGEAILAEL